MLKTCLYKAFCFILCASQVFPVPQARKQYIDTYKDIAVRQMHTYGIPASIILAQACLESGDGNSRLARQANNHFGIKCHDWEGDSIFHDDDEPGECFRKYSTAEDSFLDHSVFLRTRPRYAFLFELEKDDYKGWAHGLKQAGYATNPHYATLLIDVIEKNDLHRFDVLLPQDVTAEELPEIPVSFYTESTDAEGVYFVDVERKVLQTNGVRYVLSAPGDTYRSLAAEFGLFRGELTRFNDVPRKAELVVGEKVYLERKAKKVAKTAPDNTVISGESLPDIAQRYGIRLQVLRSLNPGLEDYPAPATLVRLR
ncbi:MAG: LysM peptidoglycan-binding domain-containing protein [Bacteroidales bacterium]|jgi:hypothetical protein|nr:glucosaminidase domain-containing protein [Bacteroidales bacterium]NLK79822.1 LysM peptidoglycan-binding domain-containing protein [Bacteroidales bacterium]HKM31152.1 glucosaminidase domain-containing protein [Bacteroidales bacterium]HPX80024.1 glucosaminidase domain-containing protein [Bacteroidales bacterium]HQB23641.1 glucosaminidase domain-containing protein [Bacteroidales bacterium]